MKAALCIYRIPSVTFANRFFETGAADASLLLIYSEIRAAMAQSDRRRWISHLGRRQIRGRVLSRTPSG
jgi:hypothetical protein